MVQTVIALPADRRFVCDYTDKVRRHAQLLVEKEPFDAHTKELRAAYHLQYANCAPCQQLHSQILQSPAALTA